MRLQRYNPKTPTYDTLDLMQAHDRISASVKARYGADGSGARSTGPLGGGGVSAPGFDGAEGPGGEPGGIYGYG